MGSSTTDQTTDRPSGLSDPSSNIELTKPSGEPFARAHDPAVDDFADAQAGGGSNGDDFLDLQETVISKDRPVVQSSIDGEIPIITGTSKELGKLLEGASLEHLNLEKFVGGGGMGAVFRALDTKLNRTVAVKVLTGSRTDTETLRRFQKEAQNAAKLEHENIARVYHVGEDQGLHYIVFEFIEGINIRDLVKQNGAMPLDEAISYVRQVTVALEHACQRGLVHRDIKPSNVLVTAQGRAKLVDMGLARHHRLDPESEDITASGVTLGTFDYISPEQARDPRAADVRSDLYSLGCTLYFMLTGRPPFPEGTVLQKLLKHSGEEPSDPRHVRPDLDEQVVEIMSRLLEKKPVDRYQHPRELMADLDSVVERLDLPGIARNGAAGRDRQPGLSLAIRCLPWAIPLAVLLAAVFALDKVWSTDPSDDFIGTRVELAPLERSEVETPAPKPAVESDEERDSGASKDTSGTGEGPRAKPHAKPPSADADAGPPETEPKESPPPSKGELPVPKETGTVKPMPESGADRPAEVPAGVPDTPDGDSSTTDPSSAKPIDATDDNEPSNTDTTPTKPQDALAERIIVGPLAGDTPVDAVVVESLAAACEEAAAKGVDTIELHFDGMHEEHPFDVTSKQLTVRNGVGFKPTIVFRPSFKDMAQDRQMIRLGPVELDWQGVNLHFELPDESADGWSLFRLRHIISLKIRDSMVTVRNIDESGRLLQPRVAVFEIENGTVFGAQTATKKLGPYISLHQCIVRGQATIVHAKEVSPFRFACQQCLLVTSDRLVDVGGTQVRPRLEDGPNEVTLEHVTAVLGRGMCRFSTDETTHQPVWQTKCTYSIVYVTDPGAPVIEWKGASDIGDVVGRLFVRGGDNFYPGSMTLLRISPTGDPRQYVDSGFDQRNEAWYKEETPPRFGLSWKKEPPLELTEDLQGPADYALDERESNPARNAGDGTPAGVDHAVLPVVPGDGAQPEGSVAGPSSAL